MRLTLSLALMFLTALSVPGQTEEAKEASGEATAIAGLKKLMAKTRQGRDKPTPEDLKVRREAGTELARLGEQFLKDYPKSEKAEDAHGLINIGLLEASVAGDAAAAETLEKRATKTLKDPTVAEQMKLHTFAVNYIAHWAIKNGKTNLNQGSAEFQRAYRDSFFEAVDVLSDKDSIFQMLLLQAKSGREMTAEEKRAIAQRVAEHAHASASIKAEARKILSGAQASAVGKPLDLSFTAVDGKKVDLKDFAGKVVLIDFWATWCGPCIGQVPALKKAYNTYHARGFEIIGISLDDKKEDLLEFTRKHEMPWPQYFDGKHWNNEISFRFGINSVPTTWLIDKKGILRSTSVHGDLERSVERLLNEEQAAN